MLSGILPEMRNAAQTTIWDLKLEMSLNETRAEICIGTVSGLEIIDEC